MSQKHDMLGILLAIITGASFMAALLICTFFPRMILPNLDGPVLVLLSLVVLVLDYYFVHGSQRDFRLIPIYAAIIFGLFPWITGFAAPGSALMLALIGALVFSIVTYLFDTIVDRLSSGSAGKTAPLISAFGLYLAAQCLMGIV